MPFPLAHPAAVLPLRRLCPQWLDFPALVIGSMVPDLGYAFGAARVSEFSHRLFPGALVFDLPVGLASWLIFSVLRRPVTERLPGNYRAALLPSCQQPVGLSGRLFVSLAIGILSHLLLDSATHTDGWILRRLMSLSRFAFGLGHNEHKAGDILYYVCSFIGVGWLTLSYWQWLEGSVGLARPRHPGVKIAAATLFASLMLLVGGLARGMELTGLVMIGAISLLLAAGFLIAADRVAARSS
jgi:hypothetical protein